MQHTFENKMKNYGNWMMITKVTLVQYTGLLAVILSVAIGGHLIYGNIINGANLNVLAMNMVFEGIMALGMTFVIISGGVDLSVSSVFAFGEICVAKLTVEGGVTLILAVALTLLICALIGMLNGVLTDIFGVHPLIITLGTQLALRGFNLAVTGGHSVSGLSAGLLFLGQGKIFGMNIPIWFFVLAGACLGVGLAHHRFFRQIYFIGGSERAARLSGISVTQVKVVIYALSAVLAGASGVMAAGTYGAANWAHGNMSELKAIAAVAIGGANINGGSGTILGTVLGVTFLAVVHNTFVTSAINPFWYDVFTGVMLLIAVVLNRIIDYRNALSLLRLKQKKMDQIAASLQAKEGRK